jgi:hypothetical protein
VRARHTLSRHRPPTGRREAPPDDGLRRAIQYSEALVMEPRSRGLLDTPLEPVIGFAEGETRWRSMTVLARSDLSAVAQPAEERLDPFSSGHDGLPSRSPSGNRRGRPIRSAHLTIFWHCGCGGFSFRKRLERMPGNEPSMVLAENALSKGSGNADSQRFVRGSWGSGHGRPSRCDSGCVRAHPASWRASASYRPLRAVWAVAPGHSGVARDHQTPPAPIRRRTRHKESQR